MRSVNLSGYFLLPPTYYYAYTVGLPSKLHLNLTTPTPNPFPVFESWKCACILLLLLSFFAYLSWKSSFQCEVWDAGHEESTTALILLPGQVV